MKPKFHSGFENFAAKSALENRVDGIHVGPFTDRGCAAFHLGGIVDVTFHVLNEKGARFKPFLTLNSRAIDQSRHISLVVLNVPIQIIRSLEAFATQMALVRPNGVNIYLVQLQIVTRLALVQTPCNITNGNMCCLVCAFSFFRTEKVLKHPM